MCIRRRVSLFSTFKEALNRVIEAQQPEAANRRERGNSQEKTADPLTMGWLRKTWVWKLFVVVAVLHYFYFNKPHHDFKLFLSQIFSRFMPQRLQIPFKPYWSMYKHYKHQVKPPFNLSSNIQRFINMCIRRRVSLFSTFKEARSRVIEAQQPKAANVATSRKRQRTHLRWDD